MAKTNEELEADITKCKQDVFAIITEMKKDIKAGDEKRNKMDEKLDALKQDSLEEREGMKEVISTIKELTTAVKELKQDSDVNTDFRTEFQKKWVKYSSMIVGAGATLGGIYTIIVFLQKNGVVFIIEAAGK